MPTWLTNAPWLAIAGLFVVAMARGQATYWLARVAVQGAAGHHETDAPWRQKMRRWLDGHPVARARAALERWGLPLISLCYVTIGFQTIVLATSGVVKVAWPRFTLAQIPGAFAWAVIYSTIGLAAFEAAFGSTVASPLGIAVIAGIVLLLVGTWLLRRAGLRRHRDTPDA